ncbi:MULTISPECIES: hypothetical protein [unclassified Paenarthrobacter]|uniref:DUF6984 family protein n=1 Tax=unclassified Paenarthrobacter TaxID=2634190 RepID=UPI001AA10FFF|nr:MULTISPECIES: hypothetical protein [unclassified Paenarthrobacter]MCM0616212.1 hypothetical protein [Paenarthrobacter sp. TYUT067]
MAFRSLLPGEVLIMKTLLDRVDEPKWSALDLDALRVSDMNDGGMGSLLFESTKPSRRYGLTLSEGWFNDEDGFPVLVAINLDKDNDVFELDSWKVDFSPRRRMPKSAAEIVSDPADLQQEEYVGPKHINGRPDAPDKPG